MSTYQDWRLETKDGELIAIFAPSFEWEPTATNDTTEEPLPGADTDALILDLSKWLMEVTVQGQFEDGDELRSAHIDALTTEIDIFNTVDDITATAQAQYAFEQIVFASDPPYNLYLGDWEFTASDRSEVDESVNRFPNVSLTEVRTPETAGLTRSEYLFRFTSGFVES